MVRPLRVEYEGAYYHVMNRGRGRRLIYHGEKYYKYFLWCLEQSHIRFALEIHAYCLMGNHYHLLVRTPRGNLSRAMRHINAMYTQHYNFLRKTDGPLFRGRYKAINIEESSYLLSVSRYIHRNPIETKQPMVRALADYRWSSYPAYLTEAAWPNWLYKGAVYSELGSGRPIQGYKRFVEAGVDKETSDFYKKGFWPAVRGSEAFVEKAYLHSNTGSSEVTALRREIKYEDILKAVSVRFDCDVHDLLRVKRGANVDNAARSVAIKLCQERGGMKLREIGAVLGIGSDSGVSKAISRITNRLLEDKQLRKVYKVICQDLTP